MITFLIVVGMSGLFYVKLQSMDRRTKLLEVKIATLILSKNVDDSRSKIKF